MGSGQLVHRLRQSENGWATPVLCDTRHDNSDCSVMATNLPQEAPPVFSPSWPSGATLGAATTLHTQYVPPRSLSPRHMGCKPSLHSTPLPFCSLPVVNRSSCHAPDVGLEVGRGRVHLSGRERGGGNPKSPPRHKPLGLLPNLQAEVRFGAQPRQF